MVMHSATGWSPTVVVTRICLRTACAGHDAGAVDAAAGPPDHRPGDDDHGACDLSDACLATGVWLHVATGLQ